MQSNVDRAILQRLESLETIGIKLGLQNIDTLLQHFHNPQNQYSSLLIAGTNGKGSVGAMIEQMLVASKIKTGYYISPHLIDVRERIRLNAEMIPEDEFYPALKKIFTAVDLLLNRRQLEAVPTYFETLTAAALNRFGEKAVEAAVLEVGMGGRYDATNIVLQSVSVITAIGYDHEEHLGSNLRDIAFEKAGICKKAAPLITGSLPEEAVAAIHEVVASVGCPWVQVDFSAIESLRLEQGFPVFFYRPWNREVRINLRGRHQAQNAIIAIRASEALGESIGSELGCDLLADALHKVEWPARLQLLQLDPPVLLDCAHNPMGVRTLAAFMQEMKWQRAIALFTAMKDKKVIPMLGAISGQIDEIVLTRVEPHHRCASIETLSGAAEAAAIPFHTRDSFEEALLYAKDLAEQRGMPLVIFGSIYLAGEVLALEKKISNSQ